MKKRFRSAFALLLPLLLGGCPAGVVGGGSSGGMAAPGGAPSSGIVSAPPGAPSMGGGDANLQGAPDDGEAPAAERRSADPTAGADTPITVTGNPAGFTPKNPPCRGIRTVHICFSQVRVERAGEKDELGRWSYSVTGLLMARINEDPPKALTSPWLLAVYDLLHPEQPAGKTNIHDGEFAFLLNADSGRPIRIEEKFCGRLARLDFKTPEETASPLLLESCSASADTDQADPDWTSEEVPPEPPTPILLPPLPVPPKEVVPVTPPNDSEGGDSPLDRAGKNWRLDRENRPYRPLGPE